MAIKGKVPYPRNGEITWTDDELAEIGIDKKRLRQLVNQLVKCADEMREMNLCGYIATGSINLHPRDRNPHADSRAVDFDAIIASIDDQFDGGDW